METKVSKSSVPLRHSMRLLDLNSKDKGVSLYQLQTLNNRLQNEQIEKKKFRQKMKQQRMISQKIGQYVNEQIGKVQNTGAYFASRLQQEKRKYNILIALVSHYQTQIYNQKKEKHKQQMKIKKINKSAGANSTFYQQISTQKNQNKQQQICKNQQLQQTLSQLDQLEKNYEQFIVKNNNSQYQLTNKLDQVRTLRSERTIFNKVFDQFQKELFNLQFSYKQLVIQRSVLQNCFQQKVKQFEILYQKAQKQCQRQTNNHKKKLQTERIQFLQELSTRRQGLTLLNEVKYFSEETQRYKFEQKTNYNRYNQQYSSNRFTIAQEMQIKDPRFQLRNGKGFFERKVDFKQAQNSGGYSNRSGLSHSRGLSSNLNSLRLAEKKTMRQKPINEQKNLEYEQKVKDLYNDLKISHSSQIPQLVSNLEQRVENLYKQAEELYEKVYQKQKFLQNANKKIKQTDKSGLILFQSSQMPKNSDQNRKMQLYLAHRQQLYDKISNLSNQKQKVILQLDEFMKKQMLKLQNIFQAQKIYIRDIIRLEQNQNDVKQQDYFQTRKEKLERAVQILENLLTKIIPDNQKLKINYLTKKQKKKKGNKQKLDESKQTQSKRDTHNSAQSQNFLGNLSNNSYLFKLREDKEKLSQFNRQKYCPDIMQDQFNENCLEQILKANRTTHNNMSIYSQQQLIQISKLNLNLAKNKNKRKHQSTLMQKQLKSQNDKNRDQNSQIRKDSKRKQSKFHCQSQEPSINGLSEVKSIY